MTAEGVCGDIFANDAIKLEANTTASVATEIRDSFSTATSQLTLTPYLREKDFGSLEGVKWYTLSASMRSSSSSLSSTPFVASESQESMTSRVQLFLSEFLVPVILNDDSAIADGRHRNVAIVSHGIILRQLWQSILSLFDPQRLQVSIEVAARSGTGVPLHPPWSNTGFLELIIERPETTSILSADTSLSTEVSMSTAILASWALRVLDIDSKTHLLDLRRARGGIGSATHDQRQRKIESFFPKPRPP